MAFALPENENQIKGAKRGVSRSQAAVCKGAVLGTGILICQCPQPQQSGEFGCPQSALANSSEARSPRGAGAPQDSAEKQAAGRSRSGAVGSSSPRSSRTRNLWALKGAAGVPREPTKVQGWVALRLRKRPEN